jgi:GLPGLI family protein
MKTFLLIGLLASTAIAQGQMKEGKVVYERTMQMQNRIRGVSEDVARRIPTSRTDVFELLFGNNQSLWQMLPDATPETNSFSGGGNMVVTRFGGTDDVVYYNFDKAVRVDQRELSDRKYLISDSIRKLNWKLTGETKEILGYTARKATTVRIGTRPQVSMENGEMKSEQVADTANITAWFTTQIPVPAGPEYGGQLPGLILELDMNNGRLIYKAVEVSPKVKLDNIKEPKGGKKITADDFAKERMKMMEDMRRNLQSSGGQIRIAN